MSVVKRRARRGRKDSPTFLCCRKVDDDDLRLMIESGVHVGPRRHIVLLLFVAPSPSVHSHPTDHESMIPVRLQA